MSARADDGAAHRRGTCDGTAGSEPGRSTCVCAVPLTGLRGTLSDRNRSPWRDDRPIREELFSVERLEAHARSLALAQPVAARPAAGRPLARRLADNERLLIHAYRDTSAALENGSAVTPAAQWIFDNFHLIEKQVREIRRDLPASYYRQLPKLISGPFAGYPRVFGIVWGFVAHTDSLFDPETMERYVRAYQGVQPLTIGELWAVAITLRVILVENLRRIGERIVASRTARHAADALAERWLDAVARSSEPPMTLLADASRGPLAEAFAAQLLHRLRDRDGAVGPALTWLDERLAAQGTSADEAVRTEHDRQVAATLSVRNIITSLRLISEVDWTDLVERMSLVDDVMGSVGPFRQMDFPTRNRYRTAVEDLARGAGRSELEVAHAAKAAAVKAASPNSEPRRTDIGYHLIGAGRSDFERALGYRAPLKLWPGRIARKLGMAGYGSAIISLALLILAVPLAIFWAQGLSPTWLVILGVLGAVSALDVGVALVNAIVTRGVPAGFLPALELSEGVPPNLRTLVAVPILLTSRPAIEAQIEGLEAHHLASLEGNLHFALLSDWMDSTTERAAEDEALLAIARDGVAALNRKYGPAPGGPRFLLLHRRRVWTESERCWMGWERKRGKLHELNRLLRGAVDTTFIGLEETPAPPAGVRYVITLDADTRLPHDTVRRLIGKMGHPLNRPRFDPVAGRVVDGYGVLQPRITPSLPVEHRGTIFQRLFSASSGIDPYAAAVSDVYQDLFGEGSFAGKGIYDIDAFEAALAGRIPEGALLSHDLFEGVFARAGLASDVEVVEASPMRYEVAAKRHHRWARGDWQLLPWIFGLARAPGLSARARRLPTVGRWKMLDNLRRALTAPAAVAALLAGWGAPGRTPYLWSLFILVAAILPALLPLVDDLAPRRAGVSARSRMKAVGEDLRLALGRAGLLVILLADQAWLMTDAVARTLWRLLVSRRRLLEWVTAAQTESQLKSDLASVYRHMYGAILLALVAAVSAVTWARAAWPLGAAFALVWATSPWVARYVSLTRPIGDRQPLSAQDSLRLRLTARLTWRYFETFVTADDNSLPPDNFQEDPPALARRTSPTNIGLYLLSVASAHDFGWIGRGEAGERLEATLATLERMPRHQGHFFNWYDTRDLRPLEPLYVSTVDSGNLAGHLIALANTCDAWTRAAPAFADRLAGAGDALCLAREALGLMRDDPSAHRAWRPIDDALAALSDRLRSPASGHDPELIVAVQGELDAVLHAAHSLASERDDGGDLQFWLDTAQATLTSHRRDAAGEVHTARLAAIAAQCRRLAAEMEFGFLLDPSRKLLSIGYRTTEGVRDSNCYDLLASEARLASFFAIAKGDVPARHWFRLGHAVTPVGDGAALISWSGSMFEYLMPSLVMRSPAGSLMDGSNQAVVRRQIEYGRRHGRPWGVSESAYNARDLELTYQYSNFGIPSLGLKRGLGDEAVVAPYATALAAMIDPQAATENLQALAQVGARGRYGFYEALDYTPTRVPEGRTLAVVRAFMAHHQGMTIVALANALLGGRMRERFHAEPMVQASELLLQERMPREVLAPSPATALHAALRSEGPEPVRARRYGSAHTLLPATHLLSNGRYSVMLTNAGSGYSRWGDVALTRWREDPTCDPWGTYIYLRDTQSGALWSAAYQPTGAKPESYDVTFHEDRAEYRRRDGDLTTELQVLVSAEDDAEVRRVSITNAGLVDRIVEITSYSELALAPPAADAAHPAFSKMFVETEHFRMCGDALLATRRRRAPTDPEIWAAHLCVVEGHAPGKLEFETDRAQFLGRGRTARAPAAVAEGRPLTGGTGAVLDPVFALRRRLRIPPGSTIHVAFWTMIADSRQAIIDLVDKHHDANAFERAAMMAWTQAQVQLRHLGVNQAMAGLYQRLAGPMIYATPALRPRSEVLAADAGGQPDLWPLGISGDLPILLLQIDETAQLDVAREVLQAAEYWRLKGLAADIVILNAQASSYVQDLQVALEALVRASQSRRPPVAEQTPGRVFVVRGDLIAPDTQARLAALARIVLHARRGRIAEQLDVLGEAVGADAVRPPPAVLGAATLPPSRTPELEVFNGLGGFAQDGQEYVVVLGPGQTTPAPWINVVANPRFGFQVSAEGAGYTWSLNSRERQLTPWSNDPVADPSGEAFYVRDAETGELWSPTAAPLRDHQATYVARHGRGYSRFEHSARGLELELLAFVPPEDAVKISRLRITNRSARPRRLSAFGYVEWGLGRSRESIAAFTATRLDAASLAIFAENRWDPAFASRLAFFDAGGRQASWAGDRREFVGRNGNLEHPAAVLAGAPLSNRLGAALDPCAAFACPFELGPGESTELVFLLGDAGSDAEAQALIARYRTADLDHVLAAVETRWSAALDGVQIKTPDRALDIMVNGWLLYQTLSSRLWARGGFYQASGAYGFRDQLQDVMALVHTDPELTRDQLLRAAAQQFTEGDVLHWWLPHTGQGVRTRMSDDRVWLPYVAAHYVAATGDRGVLDETVDFLEAPALAPDEAERFFTPDSSGTSASLYEHAARALDVSMAVGVHGAPLMGGGDWNDGMNRVGAGGRGESVWLGWFLHAALTGFVPHAAARGDAARAARWTAHAATLKTALEAQAWDGAWYLRAWFDDGAPLGSAQNTECRIDAIAQSWAVLSGAGDPQRARQAMASVERELIDPDAGLALLFAPPFEETSADPGYIKGYPAGLRENGGQYTHAALWTVMAFAELGEGDKAHALLSLLNPINHSRTRAEAHRYKVEPYVVAADVYSRPPHVGRGGWTWYTGAAGWMYRAAVESVLGIRREAGVLSLDPCIPRTWPGFEARLVCGGATYQIVVDNPDSVSQGVMSATCDGAPVAGAPIRVPLAVDGQTHRIHVRLGRRQTPD